MLGFLNIFHIGSMWPHEKRSKKLNSFLSISQWSWRSFSPLFSPPLILNFPGVAENTVFSAEITFVIPGKKTFLQSSNLPTKTHHMVIKWQSFTDDVPLIFFGTFLPPRFHSHKFPFSMLQFASILHLLSFTENRYLPRWLSTLKPVEKPFPKVNDTLTEGVIADGSIKHTWKWQFTISRKNF